MKWRPVNVIDADNFVSFGEDTGMDPVLRPATARRQKLRRGPIVCVLAWVMIGVVADHPEQTERKPRWFKMRRPTWMAPSGSHCKKLRARLSIEDGASCLWPSC